MKTGFQTPDGKRVKVDDAFKDPEHPFRIAIVCAMWLTGFDVECLATLYIDKPMKAHTLMQAIARANRVYPARTAALSWTTTACSRACGKLLPSMPWAMKKDGGGGDIVAPIEDLVEALVQAIEAAEKHLLGSALTRARLIGATGFTALRRCATQWRRCTLQMKQSAALR